ncbi:uncharacterized protein [Physcomitrium patens]|uniref:uncharacterized protein isoform X1 n=1 Tax=Physcomitrium patens TaxID=3218 RepID=UPI000D17941B|nr:zinc finger SWIM domain-containing protein 7-like isoform X1 [Physcomitrium patens]|eukprot:XP_024360276.1 zinc finger SWIM domain-containing protein 7-like isoform X1 [Physcomitrella patens]
MRGTVEAAVKAIMAAIESEGSGAVTDEQLSALYFIFNKNLERALRILDQGGVQHVVSHPSQRSVFQVIAESKSGSNSYLCFPDHFCSCQSFFFDVVSRSDQFCCKHQLAAMLASALRGCKNVTVSDAELAHLLLQC